MHPPPLSRKHVHPVTAGTGPQLPPGVSLETIERRCRCSGRDIRSRYPGQETERPGKLRSFSQMAVRQVECSSDRQRLPLLVYVVVAEPVETGSGISQF